MGQSDEDYLQQRFREKRPYEDGHGLKGPPNIVQGIREMLGQTGGNGSHQTEAPASIPADPTTATTTPQPAGNIPHIIIVMNGTPEFFTLNGSFESKV